MSELNEDAMTRASKYIVTLRTILQKTRTETVDTCVRGVKILKVVDSTQRYLLDAQHYLEEGRPVTALASVAYAEGLLDALVFLELASP